MKWSVLIYRIPTHPSRLRLSVWRRLQALGAIYLQDAACVLPSRPELDENLGYLAAEIREQGGTARLLASTFSLPGDDEALIEEFRNLADERYATILERLRGIQDAFDEALGLDAFESTEEALKRERIAFLRARRIAYFGGNAEAEVEREIDGVRERLDALNRGTK